MSTPGRRALLTLLVSLFLSASASAASLEVTVRPAYGSAGATSPVAYEPAGLLRVNPPGSIWDGSASPYGGGVILQGGLGLRTKYVSVGIGGGTRSASAESPDSTQTDVSRSAWFVGPYVRGYIPMVPIVDPWIGLGVQYMADTQKYKGPVATSAGSMTADWTLEHHGVAIPITLGVDYTIAKMFSIGPSFEYAVVFGAGACAKVNAANLASTSFCANESDTKRVTTAKGYGVWSLGLNLRLTVPSI